MSINHDIATLFEDIAEALDLLGENPFRVNAHAKVARVLRDLPENVGDLVAEDPDTAFERLSAIPGIGDKSARKIIEYVETGRIAEREELAAKVPPGLFEVLRLPGVGPKMAKAMWEKLGITNLEQLKAKLDSPEMLEVPRMGRKTIENIRKAIEFSARSASRVPLGIAHPIASYLVERLREMPGVRRADFAGSLRRGRDTIGDVDLLVACDDVAAVTEAFVTLPQVTQVLAKGSTKVSVRLHTEGVSMQADLRMVPEASYGAALLYFTGSKDHNIRLRDLAIRKKMRLNEYGLFKGLDERPQDRGEKPIAADTEARVYEALGLPWFPPELREDQGEFEKGVPEGLIELSDIKAELHAHTRASDGKLTLDELIEVARSRGFHTLAVTDHSQSSVIANGLTPDRLRRHIEAIREANERHKDITVLAGSEVDIHKDGRLDYPDDLLAELDVVVASPHSSLRQDPDGATTRLLAAIRHPLVHIIGHPTGRIVDGREGLSPDMNALFEAAAEHRTALEINSNWKRLDLRDIHVRAAAEAGCLIAIDTDAHSAGNFDFLIYGIMTARRGRLVRDQCVNAWPARKLHAWLKSKR